MKAKELLNNFDTQRKANTALQTKINNLANANNKKVECYFKTLKKLKNNMTEINSVRELEEGYQLGVRVYGVRESNKTRLQFNYMLYKEGNYIGGIGEMLNMSTNTFLTLKNTKEMIEDWQNKGAEWPLIKISYVKYKELLGINE